MTNPSARRAVLSCSLLTVTTGSRAAAAPNYGPEAGQDVERNSCFSRPLGHSNRKYASGGGKEWINTKGV
jgi:hypothetical protein